LRLHDLALNPTRSLANESRTVSQRFLPPPGALLPDPIEEGAHHQQFLPVRRLDPLNLLLNSLPSERLVVSAAALQKDCALRAVIPASAHEHGSCRLKVVDVWDG
jgi:hypothetical protein